MNRPTHTQISYLKSGIRLVCYTMLIHHMNEAYIIFLVAEVLGIYEETGRKE